MGLTDETRRHIKGIDAPLEPLAVTIKGAERITGYSRSEIYRRLAAGDIRAVKSGARTLILMDSLRAHVASLPLASFGSRQDAA